MSNIGRNYFEVIFSEYNIFLYGLSVDKKNLLLFHNCIIYFDDDKTDKIDTYRENLLNMWNSLDDDNIKNKVEHCIMLLLSEKNSNVNFNEKYPDYFFAIYYKDVDQPRCPDFIAWHFSEFNVHTPLWYSEVHTNYRSKKNKDSALYVCDDYRNKFNCINSLSTTISDFVKLKNHDMCLEYIKRKIDIFMLVANAKDKLYSPHIYCLNKDDSLAEITISDKKDNYLMETNHEDKDT